jgi:hypothetical protein
MESLNLVKEVRGINTYNKVVDTSFSELVKPVTTSSAAPVTVADFFNYYGQLFYDIPVTGSTNSHTYLIQQSTAYVGAGSIDQEKQALIDEINSLREQIIQLTSTYLNISNIS